MDKPIDFALRLREQARKAALWREIQNNKQRMDNERGMESNQVIIPSSNVNGSTTPDGKT